MADDARTPLRSEHAMSLEWAVRRLEELERRQQQLEAEIAERRARFEARQRDCEAAVHLVSGEVQQNRRAIADIKMVEAIIGRAAAGDPGQEPVTADGTSGGWRVDQLRPKLRLIIGGLGVGLAAAFAPHAAAAVHHPAVHVSAAHYRHAGGHDHDGA